MDLEGDDTATVLSVPSAPGEQFQDQLITRQSKSAFKAEVAETRSSLQSLKNWITQGRDATDLANFQASLQLKNGQSRSLEASWGTSSTGFPGQESPDGDDLLGQTTEALEIQLLSREVEAERLRAELMRRVETDGQEAPEQALQHESVGDGIDEVQFEPLWQELTQVKEKVGMLAKQLSHERDATLKLEEKTRRLRGLSITSDSSQALHQRELHELRNAARSLGEVMHEYRQQWAKLTAQVDILEQHSLSCMPDLPHEDACGSQSLGSQSLPWLGVASPAMSPVSSSRPDTPGREFGERPPSPPPSPPRSPKRGSLTPQRTPGLQARGSWGSASGVGPAAAPTSDHRRQRSPNSATPRSTNSSSARFPGTVTSPRRDGTSPSRRRTWRPRSVSPSSSPVDEVDEMWCKVLQCFPEHPEWVILKERPGVYRLGHPGGRAVMAKVSYAGLQVRVGGGWMPAEAFLKRYGDAWLSSNTGNSTSDPLSTSGRQHPNNRLLSPTKSWASRVGLQTAPDFRQLRTAYYSDQQQPRSFMPSPDAEEMSPREMSPGRMSPRAAAAAAAAAQQAPRFAQASPTASQYSSMEILPGILEMADAEPTGPAMIQTMQPSGMNGQSQGRPAVQKFTAGQQPGGSNPPEADGKFMNGLEQPMRGSKPQEADVKTMASPLQPKRSSSPELDATWASTGSLPTFGGPPWGTVPSSISALLAPGGPPLGPRSSSPAAAPSLAARPTSAAAQAGLPTAAPTIRMPSMPVGSPRQMPAPAVAMPPGTAMPTGPLPAAAMQQAAGMPVTAARTVRFAPTPRIPMGFAQHPVRASIQVPQQRGW